MSYEIRASHADRDRVANQIQRHGGAGRLDLDETSERIASAYQARTLGELETLTSDLPAEQPEVPQTPRRGRDPFMTALIAFAVIVTLITLLGTGVSSMCG